VVSSPRQGLRVVLHISSQKRPPYIDLLLMSYVRSALCSTKNEKKKRKAKRETEMGEESEEGEGEGEPLATTAGEALVLVLVPGSGEGGKGKGSSAQSLRGIGEASAEWTSPRPPGRVSVLRGSCGSCSWARFAARAPPGE
jgi:hypothetical protein